MRFKLEAGAELDLLTRDELLEALREDRLARSGREVTPVRVEENGVTDGTGALTLEVFTVPLGREFALTRLVVDADGFTPGAPYKSGTGWIDVRRSGARVDFVNLQNGLPALSVDSDKTANRWRNGEQLEVVLAGGPANTNIRVTGQGWLYGSPQERP